MAHPNRHEDLEQAEDGSSGDLAGALLFPKTAYAVTVSADVPNVT